MTYLGTRTTKATHTETGMNLRRVRDCPEAPTQVLLNPIQSLFTLKVLEDDLEIRP